MDLWDERKDGCKLLVSGMRGWRYKKLLICGMRGRLNGRLLNCGMRGRQNGRGLIYVRERKDGWKRMNMWVKRKDAVIRIRYGRRWNWWDEGVVGWKTVDL